jgi:hypothetical protein
MINRRSFLTTALASVATQAQTRSVSDRFLGITVLPEYIQSEGVDGVLRSLERAGANAVCTSPYVMEPATEATGSREPPSDAGAGSVRLLDRPLWGKRELFVRTAPSFTPDDRLYAGLRYQPVAPGDLTRRSGPLVRDFVRAAKTAGLKVYLQFQAAIPPGYRVQFGGGRDEDQPRLPDGRVPPRRVDKNGSLASVEIRRYAAALIQDLCRAYPEIDGIRPDWPEYPPYLLDSAFLDFSAPAERAAARLGFAWQTMRRDALSAYQALQGSLTNQDLEAVLAGDGGRFGLMTAMAQRPGLAELLRFKAALVGELLAGFRAALTQAAGAGKELMPNAFPPPFTAVSGFDFAAAATHSSAISVKLYTMHWPMMVRFYGDTLLQANPGLSSELLAAVLVRLMDIAEQPLGNVSRYSYPEPDVPHPVSPQALERKIRQARIAAGSVPILALAHGYGPPQDFQARLRVAWESSGGHVWINRYGYLTDEKLQLTRQTCGSAA